MTDVPPVPDEFDSEEELTAYIGRLHDQIGIPEEELADAKKEKLREELDEIEEQASHSGEISGGFRGLRGRLQEIQRRIEEFEQGYVEGLGGGPSEDVKEEFFDAAGWHPDDG